MQLYVMRHGNAVPSGQSDAKRPLTQLGEQEAALMANWLHQQDICFEHIFVSPFCRAQQTANIVAQHFHETIVSETLSFITPSGNAKGFHDYLDGTQLSGNVLVVSHMPFVSYLVSELTAGQASPIFQTAAIAHIHYDRDKMSGDLVRLVSPYDLL
ncbi:phosphohistidine phosphatase [Thalassotalea insulae]|uniref:Phosphohistidine phosphatase n=1 Tax=Thalassotalea insulae TaxID=2056778 RepID=A0ABQ6GS71_9GAMM|nr:phosphohistidine phosphatase SixA [Thalassotalea insulae]GLX77536.1 phosphohistidine phosphatase [Thalassotalea insulae]